MSVVVDLKTKKVKQEVKKDSKVLKVFSVISHIWEEYLRKQDEIKRYKLQIIYKKAYQFYYDKHIVEEIIRTQGQVDLPPFVYAKQEAKNDAKKLVLEIVKQDKINEFYTKARKCLCLK